jgi:hypothetical protein
MIRTKGTTPGSQARWASSSLGCRFRPGLFVVLGAERGDAHPVTVAATVDVGGNTSAPASGLVGVGRGALPPSPVDDPVIADEDVATVGDERHVSGT